MDCLSLHIDLFRHGQIMLLHFEQIEDAFSSMLVNLSVSKTCIIPRSVLFDYSGFTMERLPFAAQYFAHKIFSA